MKIHFVIAVLLSAFQGSFGNDSKCELNPRCYKFMDDFDADQLLNTEGPKGELILTFCPAVKSYLNCKMMYHRDCGSKEEPMQYSQMLSLYAIAEEGCENGTNLNKDFVNHIDCVIANREQAINCSRLANEEQYKYFVYRRNESTADRNQIYKEGECLNAHMIIECSAYKARRVCGQKTMEVVLDIVKRSQLFCSDEEARDVKQKYLEMKIASPENNTNCSRGSICEELYMNPDIEFERLLDVEGSKVEHLLNLCPSAKLYLICEMEHDKACGYDYSFMSFLYSNIVEVCDNGTSLHKVFVNNIDCVFDNRDQIDNCSEWASNEKYMYRTYRENVSKDNRTQLNQEGNCLFSALVVGCSAVRAQKLCGDEAMEVILDLLKRSQLLCPDAIALDVKRKYLELKTVYLDNFDCIYVVRSQMDSCTKEANDQTSLYERYRENEQDIFTTSREAKCLNEELRMRCIRSVIQKSCGLSAEGLVLEDVLRFKQLCSNDEVSYIKRRFEAMANNSINSALDSRVASRVYTNN